MRRVSLERHSRDLVINLLIISGSLISSGVGFDREKPYRFITTDRELLDWHNDHAFEVTVLSDK